MKIGSREVLNAGTLVTEPGDDEVELSHGDLLFKLIFLPGTGDGTVAGEANGKTLTLKLTAFANPLGIAWNSEVGQIGGRPLFLSLYVWAVGELGKEQRAISFTFTLGAKS